MPSIYFRTPVTADESGALSLEFPQYTLKTSCTSLEEWEEVEIFYGNTLSKEELLAAGRLKWVHFTGSDRDEIFLEQLKKSVFNRNILITLTKGQNVCQIAEFVMAGILGFAKHFFNISPLTDEETEEELKNSLWTLQDKTLLQIGLGDVGTAIVKMAGAFGMKTWGVRRNASFHPYCQKIFPFLNLHSLLPTADVVVVALPKQREPIFKKAEFELMKKSAIFVVIGGKDVVDASALAAYAKAGKFRGVLWDTPPDMNHHALGHIPDVILTPSWAAHPESKEHLAFRLFRRNLRLFSAGKISEMKNLILV